MKSNRMKAAVLGLALFAGVAGIARGQTDAGQFDLSFLLLDAPVVDVFGLPSPDNLDVLSVDTAQTVIYVDGKGKISGFTLLYVTTDDADASLVATISGSMSTKDNLPYATVKFKGRGQSQGSDSSGKATFNNTFKGQLETQTEIIPVGTNITYTTNCNDVITTNEVLVYCTNFTAVTANTTNAIQYGTLVGTEYVAINLCDNTTVTNNTETACTNTGTFCTNYVSATNGEPGAIQTGSLDTNGNWVVVNNCDLTVVTNAFGSNWWLEVAQEITNCFTYSTNWFLPVQLIQSTNFVYVTNNVCVTVTNYITLYQTNISSVIAGTMSGNFKSGLKGSSTKQWKNVTSSIAAEDIEATDKIGVNVTIVYFKDSLDLLGEILAASFNDQGNGLPASGTGSANSKGKFSLKLKGTAWGTGSSINVNGTTVPEADVPANGAADFATVDASGKVLGQKVKTSSFTPAD